MSDKHQQLSMLDQWTSSSGQVSCSTECLNEIDGFIEWESLYAVGRRMDKTRKQGPRRLSFRRFAGLPLDQQVRRYVEHPFAAIKERFGMRWVKAKTKLRNKARFIMSAICWNIERGIITGGENSPGLRWAVPADGWGYPVAAGKAAEPDFSGKKQDIAMHKANFIRVGKIKSSKFRNPEKSR